MEAEMVAAAQLEKLPVAVIGAGPVGLAAAAHLIRRGLPVRVYEAGATVAASVRDWGHVRTFSPWRYSVDPAAEALLGKAGWRAPDSHVLPTGADLYERYLKPLAALPEIAAVLETGARIASITRQGMDKVSSKGRDSRPFVLDVSRFGGSVRRDLARAVVDASGTWTNQNPLGADGTPAEGEADHAERISYRIPDVLGRDRSSFAGRKILVVGAGYSAANVLLDLAKLAEAEPETSITWVVRGTDLVRVYGGGDADQLPARGALGADVKALVDSARVTLVTGFATTAVREEAGGLVLEGDTVAGPRRLGPVDRIVAATGQRPDLDLTRELRIELDPWLESARALGPLIDPNVHSCGSVPPHGHRELSHPEPGFYTIGVKSYGRAPTFLLLTGYEQARSVAAAISGDLAAADRVQLVLPETGVCSGPAAEPEAGAGCCGGPPPKGVEACCRADADAKAAGEGGCGCASQKAAPLASCCGAAAA
jgi:thioredoxin reductase